MAKMVTVKAVRGGGQKPDRSFARDGEVFQIEEDKISKRWMRPMTVEKEPAKAPAKTPKKAAK